MSFRAGVVVFPGSNCDRDMCVALGRAGAEVTMVWHKETGLPGGLDLVAIPGGFSFGDYLRCGAIAARSPIMGAIVAFARAGGHVLGVCNGFQVLIEAGLLPGALMRNARLKFICATVPLTVATTASAFTRAYGAGETLSFPIAHHDGNYFADETTLDRLEGEDRVAFRYGENPNGSARDIAGILSANRRVLGLMPHPERAVDPGPRLHGRCAPFRRSRRRAGARSAAGRLSAGPQGPILADEHWSRSPAPECTSGPFVDAHRSARFGGRDGARHLGEPRLPDALLRGGAERRATVRATLYAGDIQSTMQRQSVVPLLLSRDPILILALKSGSYEGAEERLASFKEEIGSGSIFLLDTEGRIVAASDDRPRERYNGEDKAYFTAAKADTGTVFSMIENDDGELQLPLRAADHAGGQAPRRGRGDGRPHAPRGGLAPGAGEGRGDRFRRAGAAGLGAELAQADARRHPGARAGFVAGATGPARCAADLRLALLRLHRRHAAPLPPRCPWGSATGGSTTSPRSRTCGRG